MEQAFLFREKPLYLSHYYWFQYQREQVPYMYEKDSEVCKFK